MPGPDEDGLRQKAAYRLGICSALLALSVLVASDTGVPVWRKMIVIACLGDSRGAGSGSIRLVDRWSSAWKIEALLRIIDLTQAGSVSGQIHQLAGFVRSLEKLLADSLTSGYFASTLAKLLELRRR